MTDRDPESSARLARAVMMVWVAWIILYPWWIAKMSIPSWGFLKLIRAFAVVHLVAAALTSWNLRAAWVVCLLQVCVFQLVFLVFLALNVYGGLTTDRFTDSPLTAVLVVIFLVPTLGPASLILWFAWRGRAAIFAS